MPPKTDTKTADLVASAASSPTSAVETAQQPPRLGELIHVRVAEGLSLVNNEIGNDFEPGVATPQTVTVTTLRRLADGDLVRVS